MATGSEKCCGTRCISADLACCDQNVGVWCSSPTAVCEPCPEGQTCYANDIDENGQLVGESVVSWDCCENNVCSFIVSSGTATLVSSIVPSSPTAASPSTPTHTSSSTRVSSSPTIPTSSSTRA